MVHYYTKQPLSKSVVPNLFNLMDPLVHGAKAMDPHPHQSVRPLIIMDDFFYSREQPSIIAKKINSTQLFSPQIFVNEKQFSIPSSS